MEGLISRVMEQLKLDYEPSIKLCYQLLEAVDDAKKVVNILIVYIFFTHYIKSLFI